MRVYKITSLYGQLKGLMFEDEIRTILLQTRFGIHTFFLKKPIDVVVLDRKFIVRKIIRNLRPFRIFFWNPKYDLVVESPLGTIDKNNIYLGKKLSISYKLK